MVAADSHRISSTSPEDFRATIARRYGAGGLKWLENFENLRADIEAAFRAAEGPGTPAQKVAALRSAQDGLRKVEALDPGNSDLTLRGAVQLGGQLAILEATFRSFGWLAAELPRRGL